MKHKISKRTKIGLYIISLAILLISCCSKTIDESKLDRNALYTITPTMVYENSQNFPNLLIEKGKEFIADEPYQLYYPTMSPDENWIAVPVFDNTSYNLKHSYNVLVMDVKNPNSEWIPLFPKNREIETLPKIYFSPNGKFLAAIASHNIWFFTVNDWKKEAKYDFKVFSGVASWAPDSSGLAIQIDDGDYILSSLDSNGLKIPLLKKQDVFPDGYPGYEESSVYNWGPSWSPDGSQIAYIKYIQQQNGDENSESHQELWILDVLSGKQSKLCEGKFGNPVWSPDGKNIALLGDGIEVYSFNSQSLSMILRELSSEIRASVGPSFVWSLNSDAIALYMNFGGKQNDGIFIVNITSLQYKKIYDDFAAPFLWSKSNQLLITDNIADRIILLKIDYSE